MSPNKYKKSNGRTNKRTNGRTNARTDGRTVRFYYAPNFIWGHKNRHGMKLEINELLYHAIFFLRNSPLNQEYKVIDKIRVTKSSETTIDRTLLYLLPYICNVVDMIKCVFLFSFLRLRHFSKHNMWLSARACDFYAFVTVCWAANKIPGV